MPNVSCTQKSGLRFLCLTVLLTGCQADAIQVGGPSQIEFEVSDLTNPGHVSSATFHSGAKVDFPTAFNIEVRVVGSDPAGVRSIQARTTAYTSECNGAPVPEPYRTKLIVFPRSVTSVSPAPTGPGYKLPLSTLTLMELGLCDPEAPTSGRFDVRALVRNANNIWSRGDLTIHVGNQPVPVASIDGRYQGSVQVTGVDSGGDISWCKTDRQLSWQVTNHMFTFVQPHPNAPHPASVDTRTATYSGTISSDGSIRGTSNFNGTIEGRLSGSHMTGAINGAGCQYSFSADRI